MPITGPQWLVLEMPSGIGAGAGERALKDGVALLLAVDVSQWDHRLGRDG